MANSGIQLSLNTFNFKLSQPYKNGISYYRKLVNLK